MRFEDVVGAQAKKSDLVTYPGWLQPHPRGKALGLGAVAANLQLLFSSSFLRIEEQSRHYT